MTWRNQIFGERWRLRANSDVPAHVQIEEQLAERIASHELAAGERLPPERELAKGLGVSRMTVRQALSSLDARGLVERGVGRGTFVAHRKLDHDLTRVAGLTERLERQGLEPGAKVREVLEREASWAIAAGLELEPGSSVVRIRRLRLGSGVPLVLEDSWVPGELFPGIAERDLSGSIYALMRDEYGLEPVRAVERLEPVVARPHEAKALKVETGAPLMLVERTAYAADGTPVEFARDRHRGDRARWIVKVSSDALADAGRP
jgi:DNA-binding GntR family transcriptional regulator